MRLMRAERYELSGAVGWVAVKEYVHGHAATDDLARVAEHWVRTASASLMTGSEHLEGAHGPWPVKRGLLASQFRPCDPADVERTLVSWLHDAESGWLTYFGPSASVPTSPPPHVDGNESSLLSILHAAQATPAPTSCLLAIATKQDIEAAPDPGLGFMTGFVEAVWLRPSDGRFVVLTATDD